jgi:hypothetical protein
MASSFAEKLTAICHRSDIILLMSPLLSKLPLPIQRYDDPFLPFGKAIINATQDMVCGYMFDLAAYLALGAAGIIALERTLPYIDSALIRILHGPFVGPDYAAAAFQGNFDLDAVTLVHEEDYPAYTEQPWQGAFVVKTDDITEQHSYGVYWRDAGLFTFPNGVEKLQQMRLAGESVLYAGRGDDFAEQVRAALEKMRDE